MESSFRWQDSYQRLSAASDEHRLFETVAGIAKRLGFDYCCYGIRVPLPISNPAIEIFDTYPIGWIEHYKKNRFIELDQTVQAGLRRPGLIHWPAAGADRSPLWTDAHDFGLRFGVAHASWAAHGVYGLLSFARPSEALSAAEVDALTLHMSWLSNMTHAMMSAFLVPKLAPETGVMLTPRESEVLCWTGEGKTACEIGQILNISERTVNFHVNNVLLKLNATNKVQAVVKAIALGLIHLP